MNEPGRLMRAEIAEQPTILERIARERSDLEGVAAQLRRRAPRFVLIAARGTSDHAALYLKYLIEATLGLPCGLASPSITTVYRARQDLTDVLWVAVSQSGGSPDLVEATAAAREAGAITLAVTNVPGSELERAAELAVPVKAGPERAVAATKTYTATLLTVWLLVDLWRGGDGSAAVGIGDSVSKAVSDRTALRVAERLRFADRLVVTGRGYAHPTAREGALKLMETTYVSAHAYSGADLLHGPLAVVGPDEPVIAIVPSGPAGVAMAPVLERLEERSTDIVILGDDALGRAVERIPLPADVPAELSPIVEVVPLQRLAHTMAVARHIDPDAPRGLAKVTRTT